MNKNNVFNVRSLLLILITAFISLRALASDPGDIHALKVQATNAMTLSLIHI